MLSFKYEGCDIYTVAWKDTSTRPQLVYSNVVTRLSHSDFMKHFLTTKMRDMSTIFKMIPLDKNQLADIP